MSWMQKLFELDMHEIGDLDRSSEKSTEAKNNDVGFVNPRSGAGLLGRENGDLEGFADYGLGFRFNRERQSLMVFAPNLHIFSPNIQEHDKVANNVFMQDELVDISEILQIEGSEDDEKLQ